MSEQIRKTEQDTWRRGYDPHGYFNRDGSFTVTDPATPRHWYNYYFNDEYVSFASQVFYGEGIAQDSMGRRIQVLSSRNLFLCEGNTHWSLCGLPIGYGYTDYSCCHTPGHSVLSLRYADITSSVRVFVPTKGTGEYWTVTLRNESERERTLSLIAYGKTELDGQYRPQGYNLATGGYYEGKNAVYGKDYHPYYSTRNVPVWVYMASDTKPISFDSRRNAFIGPYGDDQHPAALLHGGCTGSDCNSEKLCLALEIPTKIPAHGEVSFHFYIGMALSENQILTPTASGTEQAFEEMKSCRAARKNGFSLRTPWLESDYLIGDWLPYAADLGSRWARVRHNGYRDMTSDTECLGAVNAPLAWERLKRVLAYQYKSGYAPRTIIDGSIRDRNFADNTVWMTFAAYTIVNALGNAKLLNQTVKFNDTTRAYSVYEHLHRSVNFLWNFTGNYGLVRIWGGDWNDCVNYAGLKGKGVSVWLSIAWVRAAGQFAELARALGHEDDAKEAEAHRVEMIDRIEKYGWDEAGGYYLYARTDDDILMGSATCDEGKIFLISQLWAVLAGLPRAAQAMARAEEILETPYGIRLAYPPYSYQRAYIGSMAEKAPGVQDNGGIYLHPSAWKLYADALCGHAALVEEGLRKMLPFDMTYAVKCGEPYAMFNSYFAPETGYRAGTPGQSWRTASSSWMLKAVTEGVLGISSRLDGLHLSPCLPLSWTGCEATYSYRGALLHITYIRVGSGNTVIRRTVNGKKVSADGALTPKGNAEICVYIGTPGDQTKGHEALPASRRGDDPEPTFFEGEREKWIARHRA